MKNITSFSDKGLSPPRHFFNVDSYDSFCPCNKIYTYMRPPSIRMKSDLSNHNNNTQGLLLWAMIKIQVDLKQEVNILD